MFEEWCLLGCYAVKTSNLVYVYSLSIACFSFSAIIRWPSGAHIRHWFQCLPLDLANV
jgi:hypothetical protein